MNYADREALEEALNALNKVKDLIPQEIYRSTVRPAIDKVKKSLSTVYLPKRVVKKIDPLDIDTIPQNFSDLIDRSTLFGSLNDEKD